MAALAPARPTPGRLLRAPPTLLALALAAVWVPLAAHIVAGSFTRLLADTYCHTVETMHRGLWGMLVYHYAAWSGRYTHYALEGLSTLRGPGLLPFIPPLAVLLWLAALVGLFWPARRLLLATLGAWGPHLLGALALCATLSAAPSIQSSLYWTDGLHNYTAPLILLTALLALIGNRAGRSAAGWRRAPWLVAGFGLAFLAAGGTEMVGALQLVVLLLLAGALRWWGTPALRRQLQPLVGASLAGAALGLILVAAAPGNLVRLASNPVRPAVLPLLWLVVQSTFICAAIAAKAGPLALLVAVAAPAALGAHSAPAALPIRAQRAARLAPVLIPVATTLLIAASLAPASYGLRALPPSRSVLVVAFVLVLGLMAWGFVLGTALAPRLRVAFTQPRAQTAGVVIGAALLCLMTLTELAPPVRLQPFMAAYARGWDRNAALIQAARASGAATVTVPALPDPYGAGENEWDTPGIIAACVNAYYGLTVTRVPQP